jgi:hypothetical protein
MSSERRRYRKMAHMIRSRVKPPTTTPAMKKPCQRWKVERPWEVEPL